MSSRKYLTPNPPIGDSFVWKAIQVHSEPVELQSKISGAITQLYENWVWEKFGDMTPDETAEYYLGLEFVSNLCVAVSDCIQNSQAVKESLAQYMNDSGLGISPQSAETIIGADSSVLSDENLLTGLDCTQFAIMGECLEIVKQLFIIGRDWVQSFAGSTGGIELVLKIIESIPLVGHITPNDLGDTVDWMFDEVETQYEAAYDTALRNEAACLLYDLCCDDCNLTIDDMLQAYGNKVAIGIDPNKNWAILLDDIRQLTVDNQVVYGVWLLILGTWKAQNTFLGINSTQVIQYAATQSTPIDPLILGCTPCGVDPCELPITVNFDDSTYGDCARNFQGAIESGVGFNGTPCQRQSGGGSNNTIGAGVFVDLATPTANINVEFKAYGTTTRPNGYNRLVYYYDANDVLIYTNQYAVAKASEGTWLTQTDTPNDSTPIKSIRVFVAATSGSLSSNRDMRLDDIVVT